MDIQWEMLRLSIVHSIFACSLRFQYAGFFGVVFFFSSQMLYKLLNIAGFITTNNFKLLLIKLKTHPDF